MNSSQDDIYKLIRHVCIQWLTFHGQLVYWLDTTNRATDLLNAESNSFTSDEELAVGIPSDFIEECFNIPRNSQNALHRQILDAWDFYFENSLIPYLTKKYPEYYEY